MYNKVWTTPMIRLAKEYGISDNGLKKVCKKLHVPVPANGYWQRKKYGYSVKQIPLPELPKDTNIISHTFTRNENNERSTNVSENDEIKAIIEFEKNDENSIVVSATLASPHPLVIKTEKDLQKQKPDFRGLVRPQTKKCLDLYVSPKNISRSLTIIDTLLKAFESRGYIVKIADDEIKNSVKVLDEDIRFSIIETYSRFEKKPTLQEKRERENHFLYNHEYYYEPSGRLCLQIVDSEFDKTRKKWEDGKNQRVEDLLNNFIIGLNKAALAKKQWRIKKEEQEKKWAEQRRLWEEQRHREYVYSKKVEFLNDQLDLFKKSKEIREYLSLYKQACINRFGEIPPNTKIENWINWMQKYADRIDPLNENCLKFYDDRD